jgi:hypothetical protein
MSITSVNEITEARTGEETVEGRIYTRLFQVITDNPATREKDIFDNANIPNPLEEHPDDSTVVCERIVPTQDGGEAARKVWKVVCSYRTRQAIPPGAGSTYTLAVDLPPDISYTWAQYQRVVENAYQDGDTQGNPTQPIQNSAGDPFDPPLVQEFSNLVININRNEKAGDFDPNVMADYEETINSVKITIAGVLIDINEGRMRKIGGTKKWDVLGQEYWNATYEIEIDRETHIRQVLDQGFFQKAGTDDRRRIMASDIGQVTGQDTPVDIAQKLDGAGFVLSDTASAGAKYLDFQTYFARDWGPLKLPADF